MSMSGKTQQKNSLRGAVRTHIHLLKIWHGVGVSIRPNVERVVCKHFLVGLRAEIFQTCKAHCVHHLLVGLLARAATYVTVSCH